MAATLANGGVCPITGDEVGVTLILFKPRPTPPTCPQVYSRNAVRDTLTLMHTCGMYDLSGEFSYSVCYYYPQSMSPSMSYHHHIGWPPSKIRRLGCHSYRDSGYYGHMFIWTVD